MLNAMSTRLTWITALCAIAICRMALADEPAPDPKKQVKREFRVLAEQRDNLARERGEIFAKIAVQHNYDGEYVLFRDDDVTAFLDLEDPQHPRHSQKSGNESKRQSHILVVPNQPREHIGKTFTSDITVEDLEATLKVMHAAQALAKRFGIVNPRIYLKAAEKVGVGYLHVHVVGERDPSTPYPPPLK
jgi:diadenosine tetraphosphate (Ap4A) HIT family hydrolase